jgi:hypothetical protein
MTLATVTHLLRLTVDARGMPVAAPDSSAIVRVDKVDYTAASAQSAVFGDQTRFIRIEVDSKAAIKFGTDPTAVDAEDIGMTAGQVEYWGVAAGDKVAIVTRT